MCKVTAIVLAAGSGSRMQSKTKKQYMEIDGKPVIYYSLMAFENSDVDQIILVTGKDDVDYCRINIVDKFNFNKITDIVVGGNERYESVHNGLEKARGEIILIHDGARPLVDNEIIDRCIIGAAKYDACIAGMPAKDTIKIVDDNGVVQSTPERKNMWITQTPQAFTNKLIKTAYDKLYQDGASNVTDDAMVVEKYTDKKVRFVEGSYRNIKITTPEDIAVADVLLKENVEKL